MFQSAGHRRANLYGQQWSAPRCLGLTGCEERILGALVRWPRAVSEELLFDASRGRGTTAEIMSSGGIKVLAHRMRRKLARFGIEVETVWTRGYRLTPEGRHRLTEIAFVEDAFLQSVQKPAQPAQAA